MKQLSDATGGVDTGTEFDRMTRLVSAERPGEFEVDLPDEWASLVGVHGGFMTALAVRGAERVVPDRDVRTLTTNFQRSAQPGPAELVVREDRRGGTLSTVTAEIRQDEHLLTSTRLTLSSARRGVEWQRTAPIPLPAPVDCIPIEPPTRVPHFDQADALLDPASVPFSNGPRAMVRGYVRPLEPRPIDAAWLAMMSDWFPPPAFVQLEPPLGGISVDLMTHVHRAAPRLDGDWLTASFEVTTSAGGLATEHGTIAMRDGTVLADSIQTRWMVTK